MNILVGFAVKWPLLENPVWGVGLLEGEGIQNPPERTFHILVGRKWIGRLPKTVSQPESVLCLTGNSGSRVEGRAPCTLG